jgi:hypothetical protein
VLAVGDVELSFKGTGYHFLQSAPFLLVLLVLVIVLAGLERRVSQERLERPPFALALAAVALVLAALFFAGEVSRGHHHAWPGFVGGVLCALVGIAATRPLFARVRSRLDASTASALPVYAELLALALAALSVLAPPLGPIALVFLLALLIAGRRRGEQKYAGLRILR